LETFLLIGVIAAAWLWFDSIGARETAIAKGSELAARFSLQLLDETVACRRLWIGRNSRGHLQIMRTYAFEASATGSERLNCQLVLLGKQMHSWHIPPYLQPLH